LKEFPQFDEYANPNNIGKSLINFNISYNHIESIEKELGLFQKLQFFNASNNNLIVLDEGISKLLSLNYLDFSFNEISTIPKGISLCRELTFLDLSHNDLSIVPETFGKLHKLKILNMSYNTIINADNQQMTNAFNGMKNIQKLNLSNNLLTRLPLAFYNMHTLIEFDISHNQISSFHEDIGNICSFLLYVWLFFFTYALLAVIYVSHVED
jgi:Leucine-rich repeat (LRR) protein